MKLSIVYAAALCAPAVMAATMNAQAASMMEAMAADSMKVQDLVHDNCPDLDDSCAKDLNKLLSSLKDGAEKKDVGAIKDGAQGFTDSIKENPDCAQPVIQCIQKVKEAAAPMISGAASAAPMPMATGAATEAAPAASASGSSSSDDDN